MVSRYATEIQVERANNSHAIITQLVGSGKTVLELGAADGSMSEVLRSRGNTVTAIEIDSRCRSVLERRASEVIITDLDWLTFVSQLNGKTFDVIIASDVLEHTSKSDLILHQLRHLLSPNGYLLLSLPNVAHGDVRLSLLAGRFPYGEKGILDRTHLRFFTRDSIKEFLVGNGFTLLEIYGTTTPLGTTELGVKPGDYPAEIIAHLEASEDVDVYQFILKATPTLMDDLISPVGQFQVAEDVALEQLSAEVMVLSESQAFLKCEMVRMSREHHERITELNTEHHERITELNTEHHERITELNTSNEQLLLVQKALEKNLLEIRDSNIGLLAQLGQLAWSFQNLQHVHNDTTERLSEEMTRAFKAEACILELERFRRQANSYQKRIEEMQNSWTWRLGRLLLSPVRIIRYTVRKMS